MNSASKASAFYHALCFEIAQQLRRGFHFHGCPPQCLFFVSWLGGLGWARPAGYDSLLSTCPLYYSSAVGLDDRFISWCWCCCWYSVLVPTIAHVFVKFLRQINDYCTSTDTTGHPAEQPQRAKGDCSRLQDRQSGSHWLEKQRLCGLRVQDLRSNLGQARRRKQRFRFSPPQY